MVENNLLMQFQADILNRPVVRPSLKETTALGAAYAAGLAVGFYKSLDDLRANWSVDHTWQPNLEAAKARRNVPALEESRDAIIRLGGLTRRADTEQKDPGIEVVKDDFTFFWRVHGHSDADSVGNGVVANVLLRKSKGEGGGWIVITAAGHLRFCAAC